MTSFSIATMVASSGSSISLVALNSITSTRIGVARDCPAAAT
jgi:hypothetical protein